MKIAVIGAGYVGLVTAACFSELGFDTWCVDRDRTRVDALKAGRTPFHEPGLEPLIQDNQARGRLTFDRGMSAALNGASVVFIAVGTPESEDGSADLTAVFGAAREVATHLQGHAVIVCKSTVPVGTARRIGCEIRSANPIADVDIASNPEFLREGHAVDDCMRPSRILIGADNERVLAAMRRLYRPLKLAGAQVVECRPESAELSKYAANGFLAAKIAYINEVADLCEAVGADVDDVATAMGLDPRIGAAYLMPGPGYGGSCFPKDTRALERQAEAAGTPLSLVAATADANDERKAGLIGRIRQAAGGPLDGRKVAVLGLAFKGGTDDCRSSPALDLVPQLSEEAGELRLFDPMASEAMRRLFEGYGRFCEAMDDALGGVDLAVILTDSGYFARLAPQYVADAIEGGLLIDFRNLFDPRAMGEAGVAYHSVGRPGAVPDHAPAGDQAVAFKHAS